MGGPDKKNSFITNMGPHISEIPNMSQKNIKAKNLLNISKGKLNFLMHTKAVDF